MQRHDRVLLEWSELCNLVPHTWIVKETEISISRTVEGTAPAVALRGDVSAANFWATGTDAIFDIRICDTDSATYRTQDPAKVLADREKAKKTKYGDACTSS